MWLLFLQGSGIIELVILCNNNDFQCCIVQKNSQEGAGEPVEGSVGAAPVQAAELPTAHHQLGMGQEFTGSTGAGRAAGTVIPSGPMLVGTCQTNSIVVKTGIARAGEGPRESSLWCSALKGV